MRYRLVLSALALSSILYADSIDDEIGGFDDTNIKVDTTKVVEDVKVVEKKKTFFSDFTGKVTLSTAYSPNTLSPHDGLSSLKVSRLFDYEHKFDNGWKVKTNVKIYYDAIYKIRGENEFKNEEKDSLRQEVRLYDAYLEGSITDKLDFKIGRQVVVWGRSDTIRVTDILNPLDNRRPGMVDIEDLRLPTTMAKLDYYIGKWRITPIAILEQKFSLNPPYGSQFYPAPNALPDNSTYTDVTYALSVSGEFSGWDISFYGANVRDDAGYILLNPTPSAIEHDKVNMFGSALNVLTGSWLFKSELAYFDGLKYTNTQDKTFTRSDILLGVEYKGIADTIISYDVVMRTIGGYDTKLAQGFNPLDEVTYQHAFRISSDFINSTLHANYLISLYGQNLDKGGFQRAWVKYDIADAISTNVGVVDYIGGSTLFDSIKDNDMVFADISYSF